MKTRTSHFILVLLFFCSLTINAQSKKQIVASHKRQTIENNNSYKSWQNMFESDQRTATATNTIITTPINVNNSEPTSKTGVAVSLTILDPDTTGSLTNKK